ncbi:MAG TPA: divalent metal cation transporter [Arsenicitalea sp.]|jgi:NRAMP (natural resistance-associated macrophage protein)-like metal ion transporter|nr:divalent metal cation transporter [Arsenicitalea sp.]
MDEIVDSAVKQPERPKLIEIMGPGLITGASDDDPSGIATYSQVGAQFGYGLGWLLVFSYPLMAAIQEISARIGRVTGHGIAGNLKRHYPAWLLHGVVGLMVIANIINIGADLGAMGAALQLLIGGPVLLYVGVFAVVTIVLEIFMRYSRYVSVLKYLTLSLLAYVATVFVVGVPWGEVAWSVLVPKLSFEHDSIVAIVAVLGTTISPYLFFWQAEEEVEEEKEKPEKSPLIRSPKAAPAEFSRIRLDTYVGMALSNLVALFIVITTAATLHAHGMTDIQTSAQAAQALKPIAGPFAFALFAAGIIGTGLLALPVLAGSAAYALGESHGWRVGLANKAGRAKPFYATIAIATLVGAAMNFSSIDPIKALFWSAVINGIVAVPMMVAMMLLGQRKDVMGKFTLPPGLRVFGWVATGVMGATVLALAVTSLGL